MKRLTLAAGLSLIALARCAPNDTLVVPTFVSECTGVPPPTMRVATYNVKSGAESSLTKVGDTIAEMAPDILALQEITVDDARGGEADQAKTLADRLGFPYVYAATLTRFGQRGTYGIALVSRFPFMNVSRIELRAPGAAEPRVAIDATVCAGGTAIRVLNTHADVWKPAPNIETLVTHLDPTVTSPTVLLGDLNVKPTERYTASIASRGLVDLIGKLAEGPTFWSDPKRLDYLFVDPSLEARAIGAVIGSSKASDHHPVWADFAMNN